MSGQTMKEARLPPSFRFHLRDDELVCDYLEMKIHPRGGDDVRSFTSSSNMMIDVNLNHCEPWDLPALFHLASPARRSLLSPRLAGWPKPSFTSPRLADSPKSSPARSSPLRCPLSPLRLAAAVLFHLSGSQQPSTTRRSPLQLAAALSGSPQPSPARRSPLRLAAALSGSPLPSFTSPARRCPLSPLRLADVALFHLPGSQQPSSTRRLSSRPPPTSRQPFAASLAAVSGQPDCCSSLPSSAATSLSLGQTNLHSAAFSNLSAASYLLSVAHLPLGSHLPPLGSHIYHSEVISHHSASCATSFIVAVLLLLCFQSSWLLWMTASWVVAPWRMLLLLVGLPLLLAAA